MIKIWQRPAWIRILPGIVLTGGVILLRLLGVFQGLEWAALDQGLRRRPSEPLDERILIVGIDEGDIQSLGAYPIPDRDLAALLQQLQTYQPRVIGVDIFRDIPVEPGHAALNEVFQTQPNVIGIERILADESGFTVSPPPALPEEQVGFVDAILDADGFLRRSLLGANPEGEYRFSLTMRLAQRYLNAEGISLENGQRDPVAMRFGSTELDRVRPNSGGYVGADAAGNQILLNFRSGSHPFRQVSLREIQAGTVPEAWIRDRIVLVGVTALSQKDLINTAAIAGITPGLVYGVEVQAHAVSQIVSAVLDERPLLGSWPEVGEYLWIALWGSVGILLGRWTQSPRRHFAIVVILSLGLTGVSYGCLVWGLWIPLIPALLAFGINGVALYAFYLYDQGLRARIEERQQVIERTFDALHNGPLQKLAMLRRQVREQGEPRQALGVSLEELNQELRDVYETMRHETLSQGQGFRLNRQLTLDLQMPLHELLYDVYTSTLEREFPCFQCVKVKVLTFESMADQSLSPSQKQDLCRFLEEALCNVGKYAVGATRLTVVCRQEGDRNLIRVQDNGSGQVPEGANLRLPVEDGRGSQQAKRLARHLRGTFHRTPDSSRGMICELVWPTTRPPFWKRLLH